MNEDRPLSYLTRAAMGGAAIMMAHQVAAKAARDALFLDRFPATDLPRIIAASALAGVITSLLFARLLVRWGPALVLPVGLACSVVLHLGEFLLISQYRGLVVVFTYLHIISFTSVALSMFWSVATEEFSPTEAKRVFGTIAASGTAGGVAGGLLAERVATGISLDYLLLLLGSLHLAAAITSIILGRLRKQTLRNVFPP